MKKDVTQLIARNIREIINKQGLSYKNLADKSGISPSAISKIVNGSMSLSVPVLISLSKGLQVDPMQILKDTVTPQYVKKEDIREHEQSPLFIGVLSINDKRITCIKNEEGKIIGTSELQGGLDLIETIPSILELIVESIKNVLSKSKKYQNFPLKRINLSIVTQSYEFELTRKKLEHLLKKTFNFINIFPDWKITYWDAFKQHPGMSWVVDKGVSLSYQKSGELKKIGGWKFPVYDLGGKNWLGLELIRHTIEAYEGFQPISSLAKEVLAKFQGKIEHITEACFKSNADADIYCQFADILIQDYLLKKGAVSQKIIKNGFKLAYRYVEMADSILGEKRKIVINGSLADIYRPLVENRQVLSPTEENYLDKASLLVEITREKYERFRNA